MTGTSRGWFPFTAVAFALVVQLAGTNIPTPLYPRYQQTFGMSAFAVTLVFAVYALALIPSLLIFGPLSDKVGRRTVLIPAALCAIAACVLFAVAQGAGWLFAARLLQGLAIGAVQGSSAAALTETEPSGNTRRAALTASIATVGGTALGPLQGGLLAQYAPAPRVLPYVIQIVLLTVAIIGLTRLRDSESPRGAWRPQRPSVPRRMRRTFAIASASAFIAWAVTGLYLALIPSYVTSLLQQDNLALGGSVVVLMLGCSGLAQLLLPRISSSGAQSAGAILLIAGLSGIVAAVHTGSIVVVLGSTVLAGLGQGLAFGGALSDVNAVAPDDRRGDVISILYVVIYLGAGLPTVGIGLLALSTGLLVAVQVFAYAVASACVLAFVVQRLQARRF